LPDSNCIVAAVSTWHDHHEAAFGEIDRRSVAGETMVVAAHSLVESFAVLTRMPRRYRVSAGAAWAIIEANFASAEIVALDSAAYLELLRASAVGGVVGGQVYDALIAACARAARVDAILTFNARQFQRLVGPGIAVIVPGSQSPAS
jgi:predicted nucleic acid-binding protein